MSWFAEHSGTETDEGVSKTDTSFLLVGKTIQCYTEHEFDAKSAAGSEKQPGFVSIRGHVLQVTRAEWRKENDKRRI